MTNNNSLSLAKIWREQVAYNDLVRVAKPGTYEQWMERYLLGVVSEMNEVLDEISWKAHRKDKPIDRTNLARELADLTKYVLSLWEWSGFSSTDMLTYVHEKSAEMLRQWTQDFESELPEHCCVVIADIDGTLADYRAGFVDWIMQFHPMDLPPDKATTLAMEIDLGLSYPRYMAYKEEFEATGGYADLPMYPEVSGVLNSLFEDDVVFLAYTARPNQTYSRIWNDTWTWLEHHGLARYFWELRIGKEQRISRACELLEQGHKVILLDDEPDTALRAGVAGITVFMRSQPYNKGVFHHNIVHFDTLPVSVLKRFLQKGQSDGIQS